MSGTLMIIGGNLKISIESVFAEMLKRAGGADKAKIAFIETASGKDPEGQFNATYRDMLLKLGVSEDRMLLVPLYTPGVVDSRGYNAGNGDNPDLEHVLDGVDVVYFTGGNQIHTAKTLCREDGSDTALLTKIRRIYENGGVIGGSSAGAAIMSRMMINSGSNKVIITKTANTGRKAYESWDLEKDGDRPLNVMLGLGFFTDGIVDQHFNTRPRLLRSLEACFVNEEGVKVTYSVSEDTAMAYHEGSFEVFGSASVYVFDCRNAVKTAAASYEGVVMHAVQAGDSFDTVKVEPHLARNERADDRKPFKDFIPGGIMNSPAFDKMADDCLVHGKEEALYFCPEKQKYYCKAAALYDCEDGNTYVCTLKYFRDGKTEGYNAAHTSLANVELSVSTKMLK